MTVTTNPLVADYLRRLETASRGLPKGQREELLADIREHIDQALGPESSDAAVRTVLDRLGAPEDIAPPPPPAARAGARETWALIVLAVGGIFAFVGWFAGVALLWTSDVWQRRDKIIGTLLLPGGPGGVMILMGLGLTTSSTSSGGCGHPVAVAIPVHSPGTSVAPITLPPSASIPGTVSAACHSTSSSANGIVLLVALGLLVVSVTTICYLAVRLRRLSAPGGPAHS